MKHILFTLAFVLVSNICFSQDQYWSGYNGTISQYLQKLIRYPGMMRENCLMPFTYVKFKVSPQNKVDSLIITNNSSDLLTKELTRVMLGLGRRWNLSETKDHWFIIPISFYITIVDGNENCDIKKAFAEQIKQQQFIKAETNAVYLPMAFVFASGEMVRKGYSGPDATTVIK